MCVCACAFACHQKAVEEDVDEHSQAANDEVNEVVEELKVHHHGFVAARKGSSVPHKTYQEDDFIAHLEEERGHVRNPKGFTGARPKAGISGCLPGAERNLRFKTCFTKFSTRGFPHRLTTERTSGAVARMKEKVSFSRNENDTKIHFHLF